MVHIIEASAEKMCPIGSAPYILYIGAEVKSLVNSRRNESAKFG